jgi:cbb3-type cytochrome c oxidase subunit III
VNLLVIGGIVAIMIVLWWRKIGLLAWAIAWLLAFYAGLRFGFVVPIPASVIAIYMGVALLAVLAYVTSSRERREEVTRPLLRLMTEPRRMPLLLAVTLLIPAAAAATVYARMTAPLEAPFFSRTVHPASPSLITVHEKSIDLDAGTNPYTALKDSNPDGYRAHLENGRRVYYQNCFFCHGDDMGGNGMFVYGLNPIPTNFTDPGTIPMLRDTFLFWRVSKGGPGLPEEGGPWDTAMPAWEKFLTEEEIWDAILFVYDFTGYKPRAKEEHHQ